MSTATARHLRTVPAVQPPATPTFIVGAERSGSTLLRLMLDAHPALSFPHQMEFLVDYARAEDDSEAASYIASLSRDPVFRRSDLKIGASKFRNATELAESLLRQRGEGCTVVGGTVHRHFQRLLDRWPNARFIHLIRDPRAVIPSFVRMGWDGNPYTATPRWLEAEREWDALKASIDRDRWTEVRFEDLVRAPEATTARLCDFMQVQYESSVLRYHEDSTYEPIDPAIADAWKSNPPAWIRQIEARAREMMVVRGYRPATDGTLSLAERAACIAGDRLTRMRFRQRRYGTALWAKSVVAGRVGRWVEQVRGDTRDIDETYIK